jgi:ribosomal protein S18 acetylase RimI-like enzyme
MTTIEAPIYRRATTGDAGPAAAVLRRALDDFRGRRRAPAVAVLDEAVAPVLRHLAQTDGESFWVATGGGEVVAFGCGMTRGDLWFLACLFVLPAWQGRGVGRALLERAMAGYPARGGALAVLSDGTNPISNTLYARHGMYPWLPALHLTAALTDTETHPRLGALDAAPVSPSDLGDLLAIDDAVGGCDRSLDHAWLMGSAGRPGWVFRRHGRPAGYVYLYGDGSQGDDYVGPLAAVRPPDQGPMLRFALAELAARGAQRAQLMVPGANSQAQRALWEAGFTFGGPAGLLGASRPFGRFDRYAFAGPALL